MTSETPEIPPGGPVEMPPEERPPDVPPTGPVEEPEPPVIVPPEPPLEVPPESAGAGANTYGPRAGGWQRIDG